MGWTTLLGIENWRKEKEKSGARPERERKLVQVLRVGGSLRVLVDWELVAQPSFSHVCPCCQRQDEDTGGEVLFQTGKVLQTGKLIHRERVWGMAEFWIGMGDSEELGNCYCSSSFSGIKCSW